MKHIARWPAMIAAAPLWIFLGSVLGTSTATATVYEWSGTCTLGCSGTSTGLLTLADGASPLSFDASQFVFFQYTSSSGSFFLDNTSPYLAAQGGGWAGSGLLLEENAYNPHLRPLPMIRSGNSSSIQMPSRPSRSLPNRAHGNF
jgi:hypothetical protein